MFLPIRAGAGSYLDYKLLKHGFMTNQSAQGLIYIVKSNKYTLQVCYFTAIYKLRSRDYCSVSNHVVDLQFNQKNDHCGPGCHELFLFLPRYQNESPYENVFRLQIQFHVNQTDFHMKGFARTRFETKLQGNLKLIPKVIDDGYNLKVCLFR